MADDYVCTLDEKTLKIAMDELHEDPKERMSSVETLRNWIKEHPHIKCDAGEMDICLHAAPFIFSYNLLYEIYIFIPSIV